MKALVTGASGFIGTHLVEFLLQQGWEVKVLLHQNDLPSHLPCQVSRGDIRDLPSLKTALKGTNILFHLAAVLGAAQISRKEFFRINVTGTENVLTAARDAGVTRVIHFSSAGVLGSVEENRPVEEDHPPCPLSVYDKTKLEGERLALRSAGEGMDIVVVRPGWVYGPRDRRTYKLSRAVANKRFVLVTKGNTIQTPVYIDDLINGILLCVEKARSGEIFHLAGREALTVKDIVHLISEATGVSIPRFSLPLFPVWTAAWAMEKVFSWFHKEAPLTTGKLSFFIHPKPLSIRKAVERLEYSPQVNFRSGVKRTIAWYRENGWLS